MSLFSAPKLRIFSGVCTNLFAAWFLGIFIAQNPLVLTLNIVNAIVSLLLALKAEELLEEL